MNVVKLKKPDGIYIESTEMLSSQERGELLQIYQKDDLVSKLKQAEIYHSEHKSRKAKGFDVKDTGFKDWCSKYSQKSYENCCYDVKVWEVMQLTFVNSNLADLNTSMGALRSLAYAEPSVREALLPKLLSGDKFTASMVDAYEDKLSKDQPISKGDTPEEIAETEAFEAFKELPLEERIKDQSLFGEKTREAAKAIGVDVEAVIAGDVTTLYESVNTPRKKTTEELKSTAVRAFKAVIDARFYEVIDTLSEAEMQSMLNANDTFEQFVVAVCKHNGWSLNIYN